jgi:hypothetical protein
MVPKNTTQPAADRPPLEHVAWVLRHLADQLRDGGTFRYLIYDRMGYGPEAYCPLHDAGGMLLTNAFGELAEFRHCIEQHEAD